MEEETHDASSMLSTMKTTNNCAPGVVQVCLTQLITR